MCVAMCVGFWVGDVVYLWAAGQLGYAAPFSQLPELSVLVITFNMTAPMVAWMRFRGMEWRPIAEMSAAMIVEALLLIAGGLAQYPSQRVSGSVGPRLDDAGHAHPHALRLDLYTGRAGHGAHGA